MRRIAAYLLTSLVIIVITTVESKDNLAERLVPKFVYNGHASGPIRRVFDESKKSPTKTPNIIGGEPTDISEFPHQLSLRVYGFHICGASVSNTYCRSPGYL